jgi:hypothetical protein
MVKRFSLIIGFLLLPFINMAQNIIAYATVNPSDAYIGQPLQLTVSVYTSTWFTSGIDLGNIKIDDALTVYFRSVSNSKQFSGKNYAGVSFYYNVFPTQEGQLTIPSLSIQIESPKPGDYKGLKRTVKTKSKTVNIKPVPLGYSTNDWLVSTYLNVNQKWSIALDDIKVGDVVQRTINRAAGGTLSEFIPVTTWDSISGVSTYPKRAKVNTKKSKTSISASRSETVNYLFEKEGEIVLPAMEYMYWNSNTRKFYKKNIDSILIQVKPNPDLSMLASIKKSLQKETIEVAEIEEKPFLIFGLTPKTFAKYLIIWLVFLLILIYIVKQVSIFIKDRRERYLQSESFAFKQVKKALNSHEYFAFIRACHAWLKKLNPEYESMQDLANSSNSHALLLAHKTLNDSIFKEEKTKNDALYGNLLKVMTEVRNGYLKQQDSKQKTAIKSSKWLNPTATD